MKSYQNSNRGSGSINYTTKTTSNNSKLADGKGIGPLY